MSNCWSNWPDKSCHCLNVHQKLVINLQIQDPLVTLYLLFNMSDQTNAVFMQPKTTYQNKFPFETISFFLISFHTLIIILISQLPILTMSLQIYFPPTSPLNLYFVQLGHTFTFQSND